MPVAVMTKPAAADGEDRPTILPRIEWATKSGKLFRVERYRDENDKWQSRKHDISLIEVEKGGETLMMRPTMLFDFASAANTWTRFAPTFDQIAVAIDAPLPPQPPVYRDAEGNTVKDKFGKICEHAQVLLVPVYSTQKQLFGNEPLHELSAKGDNVVRAVAALFDLVESAPEYRAGQLPAIQWSGHTTTGKNHDLYVPTFKIAGWRDRPADVPLTPRPKSVKTAGGQTTSEAIGDDLPF